MQSRPLPAVDSQLRPVETPQYGYVPENPSPLVIPVAVTARLFGFPSSPTHPLTGKSLAKNELPGVF